MHKVYKILTFLFVGLLIILLSVSLVNPVAIQEIAGLAVAETPTRWNPISDAAKGDNLTSGVMAVAPMVWDGANFDRVRGDTTYGLDVDVTRIAGGTVTPSDSYANPTNALNVYALLGAFDGTNWNRILSTTHGDNQTTARGINVASFGYAFDGTNWDRVLSSTHGDNLTTAYGINTASFLYVFDGTNWDRVKSNPSPAPSGNLVVGTSFSQVTLLAGAARTTSGNSGALPNYGNYRSAIIEVNVTAVSGTTPTLDVYIDTSVDGTNWINIAHFTQITGISRRYIQISEYGSQATSDFDSTADLPAGSVRSGPWGSTLRVRWVIGGTTPSFTFSVIGMFKG
jgi:hypothetical protein